MAINVKEVIKELGDTDWGKDNDAQAKAVQLLKGLAFSDDPLSNEFMQSLSKVSTGIANRLLKEGDDKKVLEGKKNLEESKKPRNLLMEQTDHFLGGDLMEEGAELVKSYSKLIPLNKNMEMDVLRMKQTNTDTPDEDFVKFVIKKFDKPTIQSISSLESAIKNKKIDLYSKKKKDLGSDHWEIDLVGNKFIRVSFQGSNDTSVSKRDYYEVK